ncbi:DUF423 domain-containing protein [Alicyclobacillus cycloheptanicus]|uniref:Uncharacterized membrane protein YgdD (TMEM256/DUF423 family) n=1 Tax=Alicyclobacillus cycloheptanicus TaxID=1457 RepID=A0ABT9XJ37_9BACL|nr:DUF423 domain-containing protein [Alicyclobacillus cycloheptanicus]MDQ0190311.1 uncharacterized membrane protein YgdD (TMEM256/DUF423 family) [Alicyclobacillus cycloheptanicus]WDM00043.1 DUF423 domain-containing protein [Alicyclobacillus cycloheptanicus]
MQTFLLIGGIFAFLSVALGAFGAHALRTRVAPEKLTVFQTGVQYQMYHALALIAVGLYQAWKGTALLVCWAGWLFVIGTVLFSGSLYILTGSRGRAIGAVTPLGGLAFLAGWVLFVVQAVR